MSYYYPGGGSYYRRRLPSTQRRTRRTHDFMPGVHEHLLSDSSTGSTTQQRQQPPPNYGSSGGGGTTATYNYESPRGHVELGTFFQLMDDDNGGTTNNSNASTTTTGYNNNNNAYNRNSYDRPPTQPAVTRSMVMQRGGNNNAEERLLTTSPYTQYPAHSIVDPIHSHNQQNVNPAIDRAWTMCSHGGCCCPCVRTQEIGFTENCGRFQAILQPGLHCMLWPYNGISGRLSLRIQQLDVQCESRSMENVFLQITISIFYRVILSQSYEAYYRLGIENVHTLLQTCVQDAIQSTVPTLDLDFLFANKQHIRSKVFQHLQTSMSEFGYEIHQVLVTQIAPNVHVRNSMDEIAASRAYKLAAIHKGEAEKYRTIKQAEAHAERSYFMGVAVSRARQAIVEGMKESAALFTDVDVRLVQPPSQRQVMNLLLVAQYMDVLTTLQPETMIIKSEAPETVSTLESKEQHDTTTATVSADS